MLSLRTGVDFEVEEDQEAVSPPGTHTHTHHLGKDCGGRNSENNSSQCSGFEFLYKLVKAHERLGI